MLLTKDTKLLPRMDVVKTARKYLGNPWVWCGRNRSGGLDCGGLTVVVTEDLGLAELNEGFNPPTSREIITSLCSNEKSIHGIFSRCYEQIPIEEATIGDIEVYYLRDRNVPCHCAILTDKGFIQWSRKITWAVVVVGEWL